MMILCTDHTCIYNKDSGYYGICKKGSSGKDPGYGGITRMLVETCKERDCNKKDE